MDYLEIEKVVNTPKINFFKEPRFGSYLAINIS